MVTVAGAEVGMRIGGGIGEAVRAGVAGVRRVAEGAIGVERQAAVARRGDQCRGERPPSALVSLASTPGAVDRQRAVPGSTV